MINFINKIKMFMLLSAYVRKEHIHYVIKLNPILLYYSKTPTGK